MSKVKKQSDLISIIVPVYKIEDYLDRCVQSILSQTYRNLEIILVDDGSPDSCGHLCDDYAKQDKRIKVIHKKNGGLSSARNAGLDVCKGKYILFIDSDDYVKPEIVEVLYDNLIETQSDISICDYIIFSDKSESYNSYQKKKFTVSGDKKFDYINPCASHNYCGVSTVQWNKLFKAHIFKTLRFTEGKVNEDEFIVQDEFDQANKISYILEPLYYYYQRPDSIIHQLSIDRLDVVDAWGVKIDFYQHKNLTEYLLPLKEQKLIFLIDFVGHYYHRLKKDSAARKKINSCIEANRALAKELLKSPISHKTKLKIYLLLHSKPLLNLLFRLLKPQSAFARSVD